MKVVSNDIITMSNWANHHEEIIAWKKIRDELSREYRAGLTFALCNNLRHLYNTFVIDYTVYLSMQMKIDLEGEHLRGIKYRPRIDRVWPRYDYRSRKCFIDNQIKRLESFDEYWLSHKNVGFYKPQLTVPRIGETASLPIKSFVVDGNYYQYSEKAIWVTTPVVATFNIPDRGLAILTEDYLYLPIQSLSRYIKGKRRIPE